MVRIFAFIFIAVLLGWVTKGSAQVDPLSRESDFFAVFSVPDDAPLDIEAREFFVDERQNLVVITGDVKITRGGWSVIGEKIVLDSKNKRLRSEHPVRMVSGDGHAIQAASLDASFDLSSAVFNDFSAHIAKKGNFASETLSFDAHKHKMKKATFTTCKTCEKDPEKPRFWVIEADDIVDDVDKGTISFHNVRLKMLGIPIAYLPFFTGVSPSVERKSGFLMPRLKQSSDLGSIGMGSYHFALASNYDLTVEAGFSSKALFFSTLDWRHLNEKGGYTIRPLVAYTPSTTKLSDVTDSNFMIGLETEGRLAISSDWTVDWSVALANEPRLFRSLGLVDFDQRELETSITLSRQKDYSLTQIKGLSYKSIDENNSVDRQGRLLPEADYRYYGATLNDKAEFDVRGRLMVVNRSEDDVKSVNNQCDTSAPDPTNCLVIGAKGTNSEMSLAASLRAQTFLSSGLVQSSYAFAALNASRINVDDSLAISYGLDRNRASTFSSEAMVGLEYRLPLLQTTSSGHGLLEPIVQIVATYSDRDEDLSLMSERDPGTVWEPVSLFNADNFANHVLWKTGVRVNYGLEYSTSFGEASSFRGFIGQSAHLLGDNAFAFNHNHLSANSGLETKISDVILGLDVTLNEKLSFDSRLMVAKDGASVNRFEFGAQLNDGMFSGDMRYIKLGARPMAGYIEDEQQIIFKGAVQLDDNWRLESKANYDILNDELISRGFGISYDDDCFKFVFGYKGVYLDGTSEALTDEFELDVEFKPFDTLSVTFN